MAASGLLTAALLVPTLLLVMCGAVLAEPDRTCYQFTWIKNENSTDCEEENKNGIPCNPPFVVTEPPNQPPNISALNDMCANMICPPYRCTQEKQCLRWVKYDVKGKPLYMSLFCGSMADTTHEDDPDVVTPTVSNHCYLNKNGTVTIEACACDIDDCNRALGLLARTDVMMMAFVITLLWMNFAQN